MAFYMIQAAYNTEGWKGLIANPQDRIDAIKPALEQLDGTVVAGWLRRVRHRRDRGAADERLRAAFSMAVSAGGTIKGSRPRR